MRTVYVECWHPTEYDTRVVIYRPWWRRKNRPFATAYEINKCRIDNTAPYINGWRPPYMLSYT